MFLLSRRPHESVHIRLTFARDHRTPPPLFLQNSTDRLFSFFSFKKASHCEEFHQDCDPTHADEEEEESATSTVVLEDVLGVAGLWRV